MRILLFAFQHKDKPNISTQLIRKLPYKKIVLFPSQNIKTLIKGIKRNKPKIVLGLGQSTKGKLIRNERVARNILKVDNKITKLGTQKYRATLQMPNIKGTRISYDAGTHFCNYTLYQLLKQFPKLHIGFLHMPKTLALRKAEKIVKQLVTSILHNNI